MRSVMEKIKLKDYCIKVTDGTHDSPQQQKNGKYLITSKHIINGKVDTSTAYLISEEEYIKANSRSKVDKWDVLLSMIGTIGQVALIDKIPDFAIKNVGLFKCNNEIKAKYLYYYLSSPIAQNTIKEKLSGTTQQYITLEELRNFEILIPSLPIQRSIIQILSSLDDKIELLREQNKTLEATAQAIFKEWFVNFNFPNAEGKPYKTAGGKMIDSEFGSIPIDWCTGKFGDLITSTIDNRGKTPDIVFEKNTDSIPLIEVNSIVGENRCIDLKSSRKFVTKETYTNWFRNGHPQFGDVIMSTVGSLGEIALVFDEIHCIAQNLIALKTKDEGEFLYELLKYNKGRVIGLNISSVQPSMKVPHFLDLSIIIPVRKAREKFVEIIRPFSKKISFNQNQINYLIQLRDTLLPKLISGELQLKDYSN